MKRLISAVLLLIVFTSFIHSCEDPMPQVVHVTDLDLDYELITMVAGEVRELIPQIYPENADNKNVSWSSSDESIASVSNGKVTGISEGIVDITARTEDGGKTASCRVIVEEKYIPVSGISLDESATVIAGETLQLVATVLPENATYKTITWKSSDEAVATIDNNGLLKAKKEGKATITATSSDGLKTADCEVTVEKKYIAVTGIAIDHEDVGLLEGDSQQLTATIEPKNATNKNVAWSSSEPSVAIVDATGLVTAIKEGTSIITATSEDGEMTASCNISVVKAYPCLVFEAMSGNNRISFTDVNANLEYSRDQLSWTSCTEASNELIEKGSRLYLRGMGNNVSEGPVVKISFSQKYSVSCSGNIMALLDYKNPGKDILRESCFAGLFENCSALSSAPELPATKLSSGCYSRMFAGCSLSSAPELPATEMAENCYGNMFFCCKNLTSAPVLASTALAASCYAEMFAGCSQLASAPALPAEVLEYGCYAYMFSDCTSLTAAPSLPAKTLAVDCYSNIFDGCKALTKAPELQATTMESGCYAYMFRSCTSLEKAPELPAETLDTWCYKGMFFGCTSLTTAPILPAAELSYYCYESMFSGCTRLNYVKALFTSIDEGFVSHWLDNVSATGKFVKSQNASWDRSKVVPDGWEIVEE